MTNEEMVAVARRYAAPTVTRPPLDAELEIVKDPNAYIRALVYALNTSEEARTALAIDLMLTTERAEKVGAQRDDLVIALKSLLLQFGDNYTLSAVEAAVEVLAEVEKR